MKDEEKMGQFKLEEKGDRVDHWNDHSYLSVPHYLNRILKKFKYAFKFLSLFYNFPVKMKIKNQNLNPRYQKCYSFNPFWKGVVNLVSWQENLLVGHP